VLVTVAICHGSGSMHVRSVFCSLCRFNVYHYHGGVGNDDLGLRHTLQVTKCSMNVEVLQVDLKTLQSECFHSDNHNCQDYCCTHSVLVGHTSKNSVDGRQEDHNFLLNFVKSRPPKQFI
jgi:hypothetical protein